MLLHTLSWKLILLFWTQGAELLEVHLVQVEFNKIISLDFILLCANWQSNWVFTSHLAVQLQIQTAASPPWGHERSHRITFPPCWLTTAWKWGKFAKYRWITQLTCSFYYCPVPAFLEFTVQFQTFKPSTSSPLLFIIIPILALLPALTIWVPLPLPFSLVDLNLGVLFIVAISSLAIYSILWSGWVEGKDKENTTTNCFFTCDRR